MTILDANVLVFLHNEDAHQHAKCQKWIENTVASGELIGIPWICLMAFLRITTAPGLMSQPISMEDGAKIVSGWIEHPSVVIPEPGRRFWKTLQELAFDSGIRGRTWTDAHLAALAIENGAAFATFDRDFRRFKDLNLVEL